MGSLVAGMEPKSTPKLAAPSPPPSPSPSPASSVDQNALRPTNGEDLERQLAELTAQLKVLSEREKRSASTIAKLSTEVTTLRKLKTPLVTQPPAGPSVSVTYLGKVSNQLG